MRVLVTGCSDEQMWYDDQIGNVFTVYREEPGMYWTYEAVTGYRNFIHKKDAEEVTHDSGLEKTSMVGDGDGQAVSEASREGLLG